MCVPGFQPGPGHDRCQREGLLHALNRRDLDVLEQLKASEEIGGPSNPRRVHEGP
jgi:hypothetical protein